jgi:hypothetical protein
VSGSHWYNHAGDLNGESAGGAEQPGCSLGFVAAVADVGLSLPVHQERVTADPDLGAEMVLGIDREHAAGPNHDVVNVRSAFTDANGVKDAPPRIFAEHLLELGCDLLLTVRADAPCPLVVTTPRARATKVRTGAACLSACACSRAIAPARFKERSTGCSTECLGVGPGIDSTSGSAPAEGKESTSET